MKRQWQLFLTAVQFYTRIPTGRWIGYAQENLHPATRYLPLVGWLVGALAFACYYVSAWLLGQEVAVVVSMAATVLLTGAFHEDGFADFCDGFGGGWSRDKILEIMKDSRNGSYGVAGMVLILLLKFAALKQLMQETGEFAGVQLLLFMTAHALSRFTAVSFIFTLPYVRDAGSKVKPVAEHLDRGGLVAAAIFALLPLAGLVLLSGKPALLLMLAGLFLLARYLGWYFTKWIGGYTGDCLGATQQLAEIVTYLFCILIWKFF